MKRLMKFSTRRAIVLMLIIPTIGFIFILSTFYLYINKTKDDILFTNIAGRQRMLSEQLGAYAHMVYDMDQEEDREPLRELVANFNSSLAVLDQGGEIMGRRLSPAPPEIQDKIDVVKQLWIDLKPALLIVADQPATSPQVVKANNFIRVTIPRLRDLSDEVVFSFELLSHNQKERILWVLITVLSLNFVLLFTGILVTKRYLAECKQAEETLRKSEKKYSTMFELASDAFLTVLPPDGKIIDENEAAIRMLGYSKEELRKLSGRDIIAPEVFEESEREWQRQVEENGYFLLETIWVHKDGSRFPVEVSGKPFELGGQALFQLIGRDITKRKQAEEEIRRNYDTQNIINSLLRLSMEGIPLNEILKRSLDLILSIPWLAFESKGSIFLVEDDPEVLVMKAQNGLAEPTRKECVQLPFGRCLCGRAALTGEIQFADCLDDRHEISYEGIYPHGHYCVPILSADRTLGVINLYLKEGHRRDQREEEFLTAIANALTGIIMRREIEEAVKQEHQKYEALVGTIEGIVWEADARTFQFSFVSKEAERLLGYPVERWLKEPTFWKDHIHAEDQEWTVAFCQKATAEKRAHEFEYRMLAADERTIWLRDIVTVVVEKDEPVKLRGIMVDITVHKKAEEEVKKLSEVVEQSPDMVFITNPNGKIEYVNPAFTEITGYSAEDAFGETPTILNSGEMSKEYFQQFWSTILSGKTFRSEVINRKKNRELFIYDQTITPLKDADGNTINFISTGKDITERVESRKKLEEALEKADQANRVKSLFIANMSHEIRTPLSAILGFTELIETSTRDLIGEEEKGFFDIIKNSGNRLLRTVHEILDISQIDAGTYELKMEQLDLCKMVKDLVHECQLMANKKNLKLEYESNLDSAFIQADQYGVSQAINNIIDNAVKYTEQGKITVSLQQSSGQYVLSIQDTGIGIYKEYVDNLYEVFSQESEGYTKRFQGIGLGMAITKRHLDLNHIDIDVESTKGVGTIFTLTFKPLKNHIPEKQVEKEEVKVTPTAEPVEKPLVLVVEDAPNFKKLTEVFLKANFTTYFAVSVKEAKQQLNKYPINLILLDLSLDGNEDGLDLVRYLRKTKKWHDIPIIALTAHAFTTDRDNCLAAGCNDYMAKPIKKNDLLTKIKKYIPTKN